MWWIDAEGSLWIGDLPGPGWRGFTGSWTGEALEGFFESLDVQVSRGRGYWSAGEWHARALLTPTVCPG